MKKVLLIILLVLVGVAAVVAYGGYRIVQQIIATGGCVNCFQVNNGGPTIHGSGQVKTETRNVGDFSSVGLTSSANVTITRTGTASVTITADDNVLPLLTSEVKDGTLYLSFAKDKSFETKNFPVYHLTVADLRGIDVKGSGDVKASDLDSSTLSVVVTGSGDVNLAGRADDLTLSISGSGSVDARALQAKHVKVLVRGSGDAIVNVSDTLDAQVSGSGSVNYLGAPKVTKSITGSGSVEHKG